MTKVGEMVNKTPPWMLVILSGAIGALVAGSGAWLQLGSSRPTKVEMHEYFDTRTESVLTLIKVADDKISKIDGALTAYFLRQEQAELARTAAFSELKTTVRILSSALDRSASRKE